jgi:competence protein CoiA
MRLAKLDGLRILASPKARAICPGCDGEVIAKCGDEKVWHWAHKAYDCDLWHENESEWHAGWKDRFPSTWQEVLIPPHRADVKTPKLVLELQASPISCYEIREREEFYKNMVWLINARDFWPNMRVVNHGGWLGFHWRWPRRSWCAAHSPIVLDTGEGLFHLRKLHNDGAGGWGQWIDDRNFMSRCGSTW